PKADPPHAVQDERLAVRALEGAVVLPHGTVTLERVDVTVAEARHEQVAAVAAEGLRCERETPRLVEPGRRDACDEVPLEIELVDVTATRRVVPVDLCAIDVRHEE